MARIRTFIAVELADGVKDRLAALQEDLGRSAPGVKWTRPENMHLTLLFLLRWRGFIPRRYADFLDYATRLIFLQKVGSGYIFIHRQLLDYFASKSTPIKPK